MIFFFEKWAPIFWFPDFYPGRERKKMGTTPEEEMKKIQKNIWNSDGKPWFRIGNYTVNKSFVNIVSTWLSHQKTLAMFRPLKVGMVKDIKKKHDFLKKAAKYQEPMETVQVPFNSWTSLYPPKKIPKTPKKSPLSGIWHERDLHGPPIQRPQKGSFGQWKLFQVETGNMRFVLRTESRSRLWHIENKVIILYKF